MNRDEFRTLVDRWHRNTGHMSMVHHKYEDEAMQAILAAGPDVLPLVVEELRERGGHWYMAIRMLGAEAGMDVPEFPQQIRGRVPAMRQFMLDWWDAQADEEAQG